ncbi:MAG: serine/threonine protein kinase related protein [Verrucomicrobiales bacterium]|nr:serine/threonine protein kinase related protein [Verrucomicrobiales bacterium]
MRRLQVGKVKLFDMKLSKWTFIAVLTLAGLSAQAAPVHGWLNWRGPNQNGTSTEKGLPEKIDPQHPLWKADLPGQSTSVIANGKLYIIGYLGDGPDLQEGVTCFDAETGKQLWQHNYDDFLSDTIYLRYATSSPTVDPETGNVYIQGTQGILAAFTADGKALWNHSLMESYGRLTFPNSRTAIPVVDGDLVITRGITANWGAQGPAGDRFYAFDKNNGDLVWSADPKERPRDNSFSHPYLGWLDGKRVFYAATGDGSIFCANARTGDGIWRIPLAKAGINATILVHNNDKIISIYGTPYEPGQMVALKIPHVHPTNAAAGPIVIERSQTELWSNDLSTSTSSPILVGDRIYVVTEKGDLSTVDAVTGKVLGRLKIGIEERNSSPMYADGKLYVPMLDDPGSKEAEGGGEAGAHGAFYVIRPNDQGGEILTHAVLDGRCFGTPTAYNGKVYIQTTRHLYCFGKAGNNDSLPQTEAEAWPKPGPATQLQIIPSEVLLKPMDKVSFRVRSLDVNGLTVEEIKDFTQIKWTPFIPPTAKVRASMNATFTAEGELVAAQASTASAGAFQASLGNLKGYMRGRVLPGLPIKQDFESIQLSEMTTNQIEQATPFAYPPLPWIGARFKFEVREKDGNKSLTKTIDNKFFQRATVFMGDPNMKNYTIEADVMSEGNKRKMSDVGIINQRYLIVLKGNEQKLEINSNLERLRVPAGSEPSNFKWSPNIWYHLKSRVDTAADGSTTVRAKAWKKAEAEPDKWILDVNHKTGHQNGCPGLFGFAPQDQRVFIDNISVTASSPLQASGNN